MPPQNDNAYQRFGVVVNKGLVVAVAVVGLTNFIVEPRLKAADNPHIHEETREAITATTSSGFSVSGGQVVHAIYGTPSHLHKNGGKPGWQIERRFSSLDEAKAAPLPTGCDFGFIAIGTGYHVYSPSFGWEFFPFASA
jgi:hypothetical protein